MMFVYHVLVGMELKVQLPMILYCDNKEDLQAVARRFVLNLYMYAYIIYIDEGGDQMRIYCTISMTGQ